MKAVCATCLFCGTSALELLIPARLLPGDEVNVLKCRDCDLAFLHSPNDDGILEHQEHAYWDDGEQKKIYLEDKIQKIFNKEFELRLKRLENYAGKPGKLLDVGSGVGHFLTAAKKRGWMVEGLDISQAAQAAAREAYDLDVSVGTLESRARACRAPSEEFDAITLWDVLEHIRRPVENLQAANRLLKTGGVIALKTPDESGIFKQTALSLYRIFGERAAFLLKYVYYIPHYYSYSKRSVGILLDRCGFEIIGSETDLTLPEFAKEKINIHYQRDPKRALVIRVLPFVNFLGTRFKRGNKLIVYGRKVREL